MHTLSIILITSCVVSSVFCVGVAAGGFYMDRAMSKIFKGILKKHSDKLLEVVEKSLSRAEQLAARSNDSIARDLAYREAAKRAKEDVETNG